MLQDWGLGWYQYSVHDDVCHQRFKQVKQTIIFLYEVREDVDMFYRNTFFEIDMTAHENDIPFRDGNSRLFMPNLTMQRSSIELTTMLR